MAARAAVEALLREKKLDRTFTSQLPDRLGEDAVAPLDTDALDRSNASPPPSTRAQWHSPCAFLGGDDTSWNDRGYAAHAHHLDYSAVTPLAGVTSLTLSLTGTAVRRALTGNGSGLALVFFAVRRGEAVRDCGCVVSV